MAVSGGPWWSLAESDWKVVGAIKINDFKCIAQKTAAITSELCKIGRLAFWAKNWFDPCRAHHQSYPNRKSQRRL